MTKCSKILIMARFSRRSTRYGSFPAQMNITGGAQEFQKNYKLAGTGIRRHEFIAKITELDSISLGDYATANGRDDANWDIPVRRPELVMPKRKACAPSRPRIGNTMI